MECFVFLPVDMCVELGLCIEVFSAQEAPKRSLLGMVPVT